MSAAQESSVLVSVDDLSVTYSSGRQRLRALDEVSLQVREGETLGIIGESGSGKSTLLKAIAGLVSPSAGALATPPATYRPQMVFQDAAMALDPRLPVWKSIAEALTPSRLRLSPETKARSAPLLDAVGLDASALDRTPSELSGGQRQRVTIARALATDSRLILLDEPVSGQDVSLQVELIRLLARLKAERGLTYVLISHDLGAVARLADRVGVMYAAKLVEIGPARATLSRPAHPYTQALLAATPKVAAGNRARARPLLQGEVVDLRNVPTGCRFRTRCSYATDLCAREAPALQRLPSDPTHEVACHHWAEVARQRKTTVHEDVDQTTQGPGEKTP